MVDLKTRDDAPTPQVTNAAEIQYQLFVTLWVMAFTFHFFSRTPFDAWPLILAGIPCLVFPSSFAALAGYVVVSTGVVITHLPAASNHFMIALLVNLVLTTCAIAVLLSRSRSNATRDEIRERWLQLVFTPVGLTIVIVYFFTVFHKLNTSFFDPKVSCTGALLRSAFRKQGLATPQIPGKIILLTAVLTVLFETLICICIAVPRLRRWGILVGVAFHLTLIWGEFYEFATFMFAIYILLLPRESFGRIPNIETWRLLALIGWLIHAMVSMITYGSAEGPMGLRWHTIKVMIWLVAVMPIILPVLKANFSRGTPIAPERWRLRPAWLLVVPLLAFFNGSTSYLGLKTVANYSMFSNLRTEEGRTNHFIPAVSALEVTGIVRDTVDIQELRFPKTDVGPLANPKRSAYWLQKHMRWAERKSVLRLPWLELQRAANLWKDAGIENVYIRYTHNGINRESGNASADPELAVPLSKVTKVLQAFRAIQRDDGPNVCRW